jgi:hypothetical protein
VTTPTIPAFPTVNVRLQNDGEVQFVSMPAEPINDWLCITPGIHHRWTTGPDGTYFEPRLLRTYTITHRPTGLRLPGHACLACCRNIGSQIAELAINWDTDGHSADDFVGTKTFLDTLPDETRADLMALLRKFHLCAASDCYAEEF